MSLSATGECCCSILTTACILPDAQRIVGVPSGGLFRAVLMQETQRQAGRMLRALMLRALMLLAVLTVPAQAGDLLEDLKPVLHLFGPQAEQFHLNAVIDVPVDGKTQRIKADLLREGAEQFDLSLQHPEYAIRILRRSGVTMIQLPLHETSFVGEGSVSAEVSLAPQGVLSRLISPDSQLQPITPVLSVLGTSGSGAFLKGWLQQLQPVQGESDRSVWQSGDIRLEVRGNGKYQIQSGRTSVLLTVEIGAAAGQLQQLPDADHAAVIPREELESTFVTGVRRATEILLPGPALLKPRMTPRQTSHGRLEWREGQRVVTLWGTPEQIGTAHGQLLPQESTRCIESVMSTFGVASLIRTGRWFRHDLEAAWKRLAPFIPRRHREETRAMALALGCDPHRIEVLNVFPELFHCSGFAVMNSATADGRLYHGRVLDYMTTIGLQDAATTFLIHPEGLHGFANVGYAGFIGSVSGMNTQQISLGEMGGRGEGNWDGVPMATLMRRALEECGTLDEVMELWKTSPRTCEYYYVFADGKTRRAVGVAATPEAIEFVAPGDGHELLGPGIADSVVLSAGSRLEELRRRIQEKHGSINEETAMWLMSRPVAMQSNLHNVLFIPESGVLWVANASHHRPAAEMPYVRVELSGPGETRETSASSAGDLFKSNCTGICDVPAR